MNNTESQAHEIDPKELPQRPCFGVAIWTRDPQTSVVSGRTHVLRAVRSVLISSGHLREIVSLTVFARYGSILGLVVFSFTLLVSLFRLKPLPLQCALYSHLGGIPASNIPPEGGYVVVDSVRQLRLVEALRRQDRALRIVVDMDDLMSRRVRVLLESDFEVSLGAFAEKIPKAFVQLLTSRGFARSLMRYEAYALERAEDRLCRAADEVVTVSQIEAEILIAAVGPKARARVHAIAPPAHPPTVPITPFAEDECHGSIRFVFIGSDTLIQNRSSIDWLIDAWATWKPDADLFVFGTQSRVYARPDRTHFHGFVQSLAEVYDGRSVLLCPTFMAGGVKTKVLEAFVHGAPVVGTDLTYEGIPNNVAYLTIETIGLERLLSRPESVRSLFYEAAKTGRREVTKAFGPDAFAQKWRTILNRAASSSGHD